MDFGTRCLSTVAAAVLATAGVACADGSGPTSLELQQLTLEVRPARASVMAGDTVFVEIALRNRARHAINLDADVCGPLAFEVRNALGERVSSGLMSPCGVLALSGGYRLEPADSLVVGITWRALTNFDGQLSGDRVPLPAGQYTLVGGLVTGATRERLVLVGRGVPLTVTPN